MTCRFLEAFVGYTDLADLPLSGWSTSGGMSYANNTGAFGLGGVKLQYAGDLSKGFVPVAANTDYVIIHHFARWEAGARTQTGTIYLLKNTGGSQICLYLQRFPDDSIKVLDTNANIVGSSAPGVLPSGQNLEIVCKAQCGKAAGDVLVYVGNLVVPVINIAGVDMQPGAFTAGADLVLFGLSPFDDNAVGAQCTVSNIMIYDTEGAAPWHNVQPSTRLYALPVMGDNSVAWTRNGGATNFSRVGETFDPLTAVHDSDTTYNSTAAAAVLDEFTLTALPAGVTGVTALASVITAKKTDGGAEVGALNHRIKSGASIGTVATGALTTSYLNYQSIFVTDPQGGGAWTKARIDALLVGYSIP